MSGPGCPVAMSLVADLVFARKQEPLNKYEAPLRIPIDDRWEAWANGKREPRRIADGPDGSMAQDCEVPPFTVACFRLGWLAAMFDPGGGTFIGGVDYEDELIEALQGALAKERDGREHEPGRGEGGAASPGVKP